MNNLKSQITHLKLASTRQVALARYQAEAVSKLPACDQADVEMFPLHLASQGTPEYA